MSENNTPKKLVTLTIDGQNVSVEEGTTILNAAATVGTEVPHYCYHPGLSIAGNCRMCLVQVEKMPKPVISCKTPVAEGMVVDTQSAEVKQIQANIMEFLLINHPLDCPTCDQAGECRLQDYYMKYDVQPSRYTEEKVHKDKMVDLGANVMLDEERCIVCTRCVRFCDEVAGNAELYVQERGNHSMVSTFPEKPMTNPYAGNTVDICPVGALTSKDFRYKKRVWFLSKTQSVCPGCSRGCNITIEHADKKAYRLKPVENLDVNQYWMCDFGRFDYKFINEDRRLKPAVPNETGVNDIFYNEALQKFAAELKKYDPKEVGFIASAQESNEAVDAFVDFAKDLFAADTVYYSKNDPDNVYSDDILITADKNANMAHIQKRNLEPVANIDSTIKAVIIQRNVSSKDLQILKDKGLQIILLFATNTTHIDTLSQVILPIPTYAEQDGHFTNLDGKVQGFHQAFDPRGEAKHIDFYLMDFKQHLAPLQRAS